MFWFVLLMSISVAMVCYGGATSVVRFRRQRERRRLMVSTEARLAAIVAAAADDPVAGPGNNPRDTFSVPVTSQE